MLKQRLAYSQMVGGYVLHPQYCWCGQMKDAAVANNNTIEWTCPQHG